jgi:hypothetical protein
MSKEFHREEDDPGLVFHEEYEPIDVWDDILDDGKIKYRTLIEAWEEYRDKKERRYG